MYNRIILMGRLVADPELRQTQTGLSVCRFRIAVDRFAKQGEERKADFISCVAWRQTADFISRWFAKGQLIHIEGRLQNADYTDKNGIKHYAMEVQVDAAAFCGDRQSQQTAPPSGRTAQDAAPARPAAHPAQTAAQDIALGDMGDFEDILSDGETPF